MPLIIKVCGLRQPQNIEAVAALTSVQWLGFIFYKGSKRYTELVPPNLVLPDGIKKVGVFVNETATFIVKTVKENKLDMVQLHGTGEHAETPELCRTLQQQVPVIKAFSIETVEDLQVVDAYQSCCNYLLFDTKGSAHGGNGTAFDWQVLTHYQGDLPFLLSGGIGPQSVEALRHFTHPKWAGIDLNSRFESAPAFKNTDLLQPFLDKIKKIKTKLT